MALVLSEEGIMRKKKQEKLEAKAKKKAEKKRKVLLGILCVLLIAVAGALIFWFSPRYFLKSVKPESVSKITVFNGVTGQKFEIDNPTDVRIIVENIQNTKMRCYEIVLGFGGFSYELRFFDEKGKEIITPLVITGDRVLHKGAIAYEGDLEALKGYIKAVQKVKFPEEED